MLKSPTALSNFKTMSKISEVPVPIARVFDAAPALAQERKMMRHRLRNIQLNSQIYFNCSTVYLESESRLC
jgi:hypothetical protein